MKFATTAITFFCILLVVSAFSDTATQQAIIQVTAGVKFFNEGDSITITEVKATSPDLKTGDKVIVKGRYILSSKPKASLSLFLTAEGSGNTKIRPEQRIGISKGQGEFELSTTLEYNGYLHVTFYSIPEGKPFGGLYFGTAKQMEEIKDWDVQSRYTTDSGTYALSQEPKAQDSKTIGRYMACDNHAGGGFFWVDTTTGKVWWTDMTGKEKIEWKYYGQPKGVKAGEVGTYVPQANKSGGGLFILNAVTGEGWWTNGKEWKVLGKPE